MKPFLIKVSVIIVVYLSISVAIYITFFYKPIDSDVEKSLIISTTNHKFKIKKIRFGDSVGRQLFPTGVYDSIGEINITSNGAISILGQYLLLKSLILNNKNNISDSLIVEGYFRPTSLLNNLDESTTTNYFLKKFYNDQWFFNNKLIDQNLTNDIDSIYLKKYEKRIYIRKLFSIKYLSNILKIPMTFNTEVIGYKDNVLLFDFIQPELKKNFNNIKIYFCPVSKFKYNAELHSLSRLNKYYSNSVNLKALDDSCFVNDMIHLKPGCLSYYSK